MSLVNIFPRNIHPLGIFGNVSPTTALTINATGESISLIGPIVWLGGANGDSKVLSAAGGGAIYFPVSVTNTFADSGTDLKSGLQDLSSGVEDGTFDVNGSWIGNVDTLTASQYNRQLMETGSKTVSYGQTLAIVLEMVTRGGTDSVTIENPGVSFINGTTAYGTPYGTQDTGSGPAKRAPPAAFIIEFDDGTLGYCIGYPAHLAMRGLTTTAVNTGSNPDEYANVFTSSVPMRVIGGWADLSGVASADPVSLHLYSNPEGGTPVQERTFAVDVANQAGTAGIFSGLFQTGGVPTAYDIAAGQQVALSVRPTSANSINILTQELGTGNELLKAFSGFESVELMGRVNAADAFQSISATQILRAGLWVTGLDSGGVGGGGFIIGG